MPPALTKAPKAKTLSATISPPPTLLSLFHANLNAMREYYRQQPDAGHNHGVNITMELALSLTLTALGDAIDGKTWQPPGL